MSTCLSTVSPVSPGPTPLHRTPAPATPTSGVIARFGRDGEYVLRAAITEADRLACWHLVYREYLSHGYTQPQELECRYSLHDALPDTATFLVEADGRPVGTVSVFPDSPLGLPADEIYRAELDALRRMGRIPVEVGRLTIAREYANDRSILMNLFDALSLYARCVREATDLVITVNPSHARFYERMILFDRIGSEKKLDSVCQAPAVLLRLATEVEVRARHQAHKEGPATEEPTAGRNAYPHLSGSREEARRVDIMRRLRLRPSTDFIRKYFVQARPLITSLPPHLRSYFQDSYPSLIPDHRSPLGYSPRHS